MRGLQLTDADVHKEAPGSRINADEQAINDVIKIVTERMVNLFVIEEQTSTEDKQLLVNIATPTVADVHITGSLCNVRKNGIKEMTQFLEDRLQTGKVYFFDPLKRNSLKSFASLNKPVPLKKKRATQTINTDGRIFSKFAVIRQSRDVNISELLQYELAPVLLSIFSLDSSLRKTQKSAILKWIEKDLSVPDLPVSNEPTLAVIDLMMLLRMVCTDTSECQTF